MGWKNWPYWLKIGFIGFLFLLLIILFFSYETSYSSFMVQKNAYEDTKFVIMQCGDPPNNDCVMKICEERAKQFYYEKLSTDSHITLEQYVESSCLKHPDVIQNGGQFRWNPIQKPSIKLLLIPNIKNGLETLLFPFFGQ